MAICYSFATGFFTRANFDTQWQMDGNIHAAPNGFPIFARCRSIKKCASFCLDGCSRCSHTNGHGNRFVYQESAESRTPPANLVDMLLHRYASPYPTHKTLLQKPSVKPDKRRKCNLPATEETNARVDNSTRK